MTHHKLAKDNSDPFCYNSDYEKCPKQIYIQKKTMIKAKSKAAGGLMDTMGQDQDNTNAFSYYFVKSLKRIYPWLSEKW